MFQQQQTLIQDLPKIQNLYEKYQLDSNKFQELTKNSQNFKVRIPLIGAFSAGKSSFLNGILGRKVLSVAIDPTTSIATYLIHGEQQKIAAVLKNSQQLDLSLEQFKNLTHYAEQELHELAVNIDLILLTQPEQRWPNLAFLDTPGYSNHEDVEQGLCDAHIAKVQLNDAQCLIWLVSVDQGVISQSDIEFLKTIRSDIPKLIVISRADKKSPDDLTEIKICISYNVHYVNFRKSNIYRQSHVCFLGAK